MLSKLKLIHLANFNSTNIGNGALITGLEKVISEDFSREIEWIREAWDDYTFGFKHFDGDFVEFVNRSDGLMVNGAVAIHGRHYLWETGMRFELPLKMVKNITKPIIFYGISYRHFRGQPFFHADKLKKTLEFYIETPGIQVGVRDDGTKKWLDQTLKLNKTTLDQIVEIPDTGVFTVASTGFYPEILSDRRVIIFSPNDEDVVFRYGNDNVLHVKETGYPLPEDPEAISESYSWIENREIMIDRIKHALDRILVETGGQLLLVPHYLDDYKFIANLADRFDPWIAHQCSITTGLMRVQGTDYFYGRYKKADLAISMRVHSMSPCIGLGVPMVPLITQPRMWDFLEGCGLEDIGIDAFSSNLEHELFEGAMRVLSNPEERINKFVEARKTMRERVRRLNSLIEETFFKT